VPSASTWLSTCPTFGDGMNKLPLQKGLHRRCMLGLLSERANSVLLRAGIAHSGSYLGPVLGEYGEFATHTKREREYRSGLVTYEHCLRSNPLFISRPRLGHEQIHIYNMSNDKFTNVCKAFGDGEDHGDKAFRKQILQIIQIFELYGASRCYILPIAVLIDPLVDRP